MAKLLETVQLVNRRMNPVLKVSGVVLTMFDSQTKLSNEVVAELSGFIEDAKGKPLPWAEAKLFQTRIRRNIKLAESPSFGQNILKYDPTSNGATDYRNLAKEVLAMTDPAPAAAAEPEQPPLVAQPATEPPAPELHISKDLDPQQLAAAKAGLDTAKAEIAAARAKLAAAKKRPAKPKAPPASQPSAPSSEPHQPVDVASAPSDTEAVA
jgi:hypothetical protein